MLLVGVGNNTDQIVNKIKGKARWQVEIAGIVRQDMQGNVSDKNLSEYEAGGIENLKAIIRSTRSDIVVFILESVSHKELLDSIRTLRDVDVEIKVIPPDMNFILGKADVEYLDDIAVVDLHLSFFNPVQKFMKRFFDLILSSLGLLLLLPFSWAMLNTRDEEKREVTIFDGSRNKTIYLMNHQTLSSKIYNRWKLCYKIFAGNLSFIGSSAGPAPEQDTTRYKSGLTGYVQINRDRISTRQDQEQFDLHYLQNYSIWLDLDILFKALIREESLTGAFLAENRRRAE